MKLIVRSRNCGLSLLASGWWLVICNTDNQPALSTNPSPVLKRDATDSVRSSCSEQDVETLVTHLLRDLPSYANRATQRARRLQRQSDVYSYVLVAGQPDFTPLPVDSNGETTNASISGTEGVEQVFFTTLERQYIGKKVVQLQQFHRLFLTKTNSGWQLVMMYTQTGSYPTSSKPPTPPRESSNSAIGQGINTWLRDCRAGSVRN